MHTSGHVSCLLFPKRESFIVIALLFLGAGLFIRLSETDRLPANVRVDVPSGEGRKEGMKEGWGREGRG